MMKRKSAASKTYSKAHEGFENKMLRCFSCFEINSANFFNLDYLTKSLKIPDEVLTRLDKKLPENIIQSLISPSFPVDVDIDTCFCKTCSRLSTEINGLCRTLKNLISQIDKSIDSYANRIIQCREIELLEEEKPLITLSKDCFEEDNYSDCNDDDFFALADENAYGYCDSLQDSYYTDCQPKNDGVRIPNIRQRKKEVFFSERQYGYVLDPSKTKYARQHPRSKRYSMRVDSVDKRLKAKYKLKNSTVLLKQIIPMKFTCRVCQKRFSSKSSLDSHTPLHIHMLAKPKCPNCKLSLADRTSRKKNLPPEQVFMHCAKCRKNFIFAKKLIVPRLRKTVPVVNTNGEDSLKENTFPKGINTKTYSSGKVETRTLQNKPCQVCGIPISDSLMEVHMNHYHREAEVVALKINEKDTEADTAVSDSEVEIVALKINEKVITKKPTVSESRNPQQSSSQKTKLRCMTCKKPLSPIVPLVITNQMKPTLEKFPGRSLLYCKYCKTALVVGEKNENIADRILAKPYNYNFKALAKHNTFKCTDCNGSFATQYMTFYHRNVTCNNITKSCHLCLKMFKFAYDLKIHVKDRHPGMDIALWNICSKCGDPYGDRICHNKICTNSTEKSCNQCEFICNSDEELLNHIIMDHGRSTPLKTNMPVVNGLETKSLLPKTKRIRVMQQKRLCENCGKTYTRFKRHLLTCGKQVLKEKLKCLECDKLGEVALFDNSRKLKVHVKIYHILIHKCDQCGKAFSKLTGLNKHLFMVHKIKTKKSN